MIAPGSATNLIIESPMHRIFGTQMSELLLRADGHRGLAGWLAPLMGAGSGLLIAGGLAWETAAGRLLWGRGADCRLVGAVPSKPVVVAVTVAVLRDPGFPPAVVRGATEGAGLGVEVAIGAAAERGGLGSSGFSGGRSSMVGRGDGETAAASGDDDGLVAMDVGCLSSPGGASMISAVIDFSAGSSSEGEVGFWSRERLLRGLLEPGRPGGDVRRTGLEEQQEGRFLDCLGSSR